MTTISALHQDISPFLPFINRAREFHIYNGTGRRFLDMYLAGGTALFGHRPDGVGLKIRNAMSRGLWAGYPSPYGERLKKQLRIILPDFPEILIFGNTNEADCWLSAKYRGKAITDPAVDGVNAGSPSLWRPCCKDEYDLCPALIPVLPFPGSFLPVPVCFPPGSVSEKELERYSGGGISPMLTAGLVRAAALIPSLSEERDGKAEGFTLSGWERKGPYLCYKGAPGEYADLFDTALEKGVLLSPLSDIPSIIPTFYSKGEIQPLFSLFNR